LIGQEMQITSQTVASVYEEDASIEAMERIVKLLKYGDTVLLKGSRGMQLERIIELKRQMKVSAH
jgi:UDP-N-acetylmuramyl pentapeptide synthase